MIWFLTTVQQALLFSVTVLLVGCVAWRVGVAPAAHAELSGAGSLAPAAERVRTWARQATLLLVLAWGLRMVVQVMAFRDPFAPLSEDVSLLLFQTVWGTVWMAQGVIVSLLLVVAWLGTRAVANGEEVSETPAAWWGLALLVVGLAVTLAMSGHAMGADTWRAAAVSADALHTLAAGVWIGTLTVILVADRSETASDPAVFGVQIQRFSPLALVSGGLVVAMGLALSWTHLTTIADLWTTGYGRILSTKVAVVIVILGLGFRNWRAGVPVSHSSEGAQAIRRRGGLEVGLAALVIVLTAILVHSTKP